LRTAQKNAGAFLGMRNLIIIMMLGLLGIRADSLISINIQDIDVLTGLVRVTEKGNIKRIMVLPEILCRALEKHFHDIGHRRGPLFLTKRGKRISQRTLQNIFRSAADSTDIDKHLHAHLFRHTAATHLNTNASAFLTFLSLYSGKHSTGSPAINLSYRARGAVEFDMMNAVIHQLAHHIKVPNYNSSGLTDSKLPDAQAGWEKALTTILAAMGGSNFVHHAAGMLESM